MSAEPDRNAIIADDMRTLHRLGYAQELARRMSGFSNYALSLSIICILAGGITSFHLGYCSVGGAAIGLGWPLVCCFSLVVALTMGQVASAFPTAGGLYHWAAILGGRGWGWAVAWFNLLGLVTVLAAINVGTCQFVAGAFFPGQPLDALVLLLAMTLVTGSQALFNHLGIRVVTWLTDFSGYWILIIAAILTGALILTLPAWEPSRLITFDNFSGLPTDNPIWPPTESLVWLFTAGFLLPAYTITGFDASAHAAEETVGAARSVPQGIVRSVLVSGVAGWVMLAAVVLSIRDPAETAAAGEGAFVFALNSVLPHSVAQLLFAGIAVAQYLCGLATVTSASRMAFAFARDGGLPVWLRHISPTWRTPGHAIWTVAAGAILFTVYTPVYATITAVCTILLYVSYVLPTALGLWAHGRTWTTMGPWQLGCWYRPLAALSVLGCVGLIVLGMQPPNEKAFWVVGGVVVLLALAWFTVVHRHFPGPPPQTLTPQRQQEIIAAEQAVHQQPVDILPPGAS